MPLCERFPFVIPAGFRPHTSFPSIRGEATTINSVRQPPENTQFTPQGLVRTLVFHHGAFFAEVRFGTSVGSITIVGLSCLLAAASGGGGVAHILPKDGACAVCSVCPGCVAPPSKQCVPLDSGRGRGPLPAADLPSLQATPTPCPAPGLAVSYSVFPSCETCVHVPLAQASRSSAPPRGVVDARTARPSA